MKIKELLLLSLGLVVAGSAMGADSTPHVGDKKADHLKQYPSRIDAADAGTDGYYYVPLGVTDAGAYDNTADAQTVYQTVGGTVPYYVAPSYLLKQGEYDKAANFSTATTGVARRALKPGVAKIGDFGTVFGSGSEFAWVTAGLTGGQFIPELPTTAPKENVANITVPAAGVTAGQFGYVKVQEQLKGAFANCGGGEDFATVFKVIAVGEPSLWISGATDGSGATVTSEAHAYEQNVPVDGKNVVAKGEDVLIFRSCDKAKLNEIVLKMNFTAMETATMAGKGEKYAFSVSRVAGSLEIANADPYKWTQSTTAGNAKNVYDKQAITQSHDGMLAIPGTGTGAKAKVGEQVEAATTAGTTADRYGAADDAQPGFYKDVIYYLDNASDVETEDTNVIRGCVSPVSMLSYRDLDPTKDFTNKAFNTDATHYIGKVFGFPMGSAADTKYRAVVLRLQTPPATGPVYHIPLDLF